jgi:hypothetical protein
VRAGHVYTGIDALASPAWIDFSARSGQFHARQGDLLTLDGPIELSIRTNGPSGAVVNLYRNGSVVRSSTDATLGFTAPADAAVFRVEVTLSGAQVPWMVTNPIYVVPKGWKPAAPARPIPAVERREFGMDDWRVEHARTSTGELTVSADGSTAFRFVLGGGVPSGQYAAAAIPVPSDLTRYDRFSFVARADEPMRLSVQVRHPQGNDGERWQRSVYLDREPRAITVFFDDMTPIGRTRSLKPDLAEADALLLVVDTVHTKPGSTGAIRIEAPRLER